MSNTNMSLAIHSGEAFEHIQRVAKCYTSSQLVPTTFQNNVPNVILALEMAQRIGATPISVMQSLNIIHGKPSWSSQFIIAAINSCGRFHPLRYDITGDGDDRGCVAWTLETGVPLTARTLAEAHKAGLPVLESPRVTIQMAKDEGWFGKSGSKWKTMPELMMRYRAATFFGRMYAPEILNGMAAQDEVIDISPLGEDLPPPPVTTKRKKGLSEMKAAEPVVEPAEPPSEPAPVEPAPAPVSFAQAAASTKEEAKPEAQPEAQPEPDDMKLRVEVVEVKDTKNVTVKELIVKGDYDGSVFATGELAKALPAAGTLIDIDIEDAPSKKDPSVVVKKLKSLEVVA